MLPRQVTPPPALEAPRGVKKRTGVCAGTSVCREQVQVEVSGAAAKRTTRRQTKRAEAEAAERNRAGTSNAGEVAAPVMPPPLRSRSRPGARCGGGVESPEGSTGGAGCSHPPEPPLLRVAGDRAAAMRLRPSEPAELSFEWGTPGGEDNVSPREDPYVSTMCRLLAGEPADQSPEDPAPAAQQVSTAPGDAGAAAESIEPAAHTVQGSGAGQPPHAMDYRYPVGKVMWIQNDRHPNLAEVFEHSVVPDCRAPWIPVEWRHSVEQVQLPSPPHAPHPRVPGGAVTPHLVRRLDGKYTLTGSVWERVWGWNCKMTEFTGSYVTAPNCPELSLAQEGTVPCKHSACI